VFPRFSTLLPRSPPSPLFPYTTLFRSPALYDVIVVGGGLVGAAIAYGLREHVSTLAVLDEGDADLRASRGNFGLVWVQSKGMGLDRKSTRLNSSHVKISYAVFCLKKKI